jgi:alginate O-acetyltransferase complex protein AlgI
LPVQKIVLADHLGVFVDDVFCAPSAYNTGTVIFSAVSYSLQIYLDFSGYSDMAIGIAKIIGFDFNPNFNLPYMARGSSDFWSRWHISLSTWFKDYLYIPLGGSRRGEKRTYINLFIVMLVSGFWHGAGWSFILWGCMHGMANCVTRWLRNKNIQENAVLRGMEVLCIFLLVTLFWTVFRAESIEKAGVYWNAMFTSHSGISQPYTWTFVAIICLTAVTLIAMRRARKNKIACINGFYPILDLSKIWSLVKFLLS